MSEREATDMAIEWTDEQFERAFEAYEDAAPDVAWMEGIEAALAALAPDIEAHIGARIEALEAELAALKAPLPDEAAMVGAMGSAIEWQMAYDDNVPNDLGRAALDAIRPHLAAIRRQALEEAEKLALRDEWAECPYTNDKPGDPTWHHTEADICPVCRVPGGESDASCVSSGRNRIAAAIRALIKQPETTAKESE